MRSCRRTRLRSVARSLGLAVAVSSALGACSGAPAPAPFDPTAACTSDQRIAGAYPDLEARIPRTLFGTAPSQLDSGRNCTSTNLGSLADHGIAEVHFAGGRWDRSPTSGVTLAVFSANGLTAEEMGEWYEASARASSKTAGLRPTRPTVAGRQGYRLDLLSSDTPQTVVCWPSADGKVVQVVVAAGVPESDIQAGVAAFG